MSRRRLTTAAAVTGAVLLLGAGVTAAPATTDLTVTDLRLAEGAGTDLTTVEGYGAAGTRVLRYADRAQVVLEVPVRNGGPLPVTVTAASLTEAVLPLVAVTGTPGLPMTVGPGSSATVRLRATLTHCAYYHERELQVYDVLRLRTRVLGVAGTASVPLDKPLVVHAPMVVGCADRKLDRQAHDRRDVVDAT